MKSYSDDIPNVSTDEIKRSAAVGEETNALVKDNLIAIRAHDDLERKRLEDIDARIKLCFYMSVLTAAVSLVTLSTLAYFITGS